MTHKVAEVFFLFVTQSNLQETRMSEESEHPAEATEAPVTDVEMTLSEVVTTEAPKVKKARSQKQIDALNTAREKLTKKRKDAEMDELFRQRKVQEEINTLLSTNKQMREELELAKAKEMKTKKKRKKTTKTWTRTLTTDR